MDASHRELGPESRNFTALLEASKAIVRDAGEALRSSLDQQRLRDHRQSADVKREIKAVADEVLDRRILSALSEFGYPVLSEESGWIPRRDPTGPHFIVDPLDGTVNFIRKLGPYGVCLALWSGDRPLFGVVFDLEADDLFWGGPGVGAFRAGTPLRVSETVQLDRAVLCTGFPARLEVGSPVTREAFWATTSPFAKVRMLGTAAVSLTRVASGAADAYVETAIMTWDVAAGLAIVLGAGGRYRRHPVGPDSWHVEAWNGVLRGFGNG